MNPIEQPRMLEGGFCFRYPPFCAAIVGEPTRLDLHCCDHLLGVQRAKKKDRDHLVPEPQLRNTFLSLTHTNVESDAEMGQRIHTLLKYVSFFA